jgi:hypothetical protein
MFTWPCHFGPVAKQIIMAGRKQVGGARVPDPLQRHTPVACFLQVGPAS